MSIEVYGAFVAAVTVLMLIPGPNVALIVGTSVSHGTRQGLVTVAGTSSAMVLQLAATAVGMSTLLAAAGHGFEWLRWLGAAYLVVLGVQYWRAAPVSLEPTAARRGDAGRLYARAFLVSLTNPKTLLFYGALFPQFVRPTGNVALQLGLLVATFLVVALVVDCGWASLGGRARGLLAMRGRLRNRLTGGLLIGAGLGLALARKV
jgi:threonine/homoserine/homoserine lactone efflux protein